MSHVYIQGGWKLAGIVGVICICMYMYIVGMYNTLYIVYMQGGWELAGRQDLHLPGADLSSAVGSGTLAC